MKGPFRVYRAAPIALIAWAGLTVALLASPIKSGLHAQYFRGTDFVGSPDLIGVDRDISTRQLGWRWPFGAPETFTAQWYGYLLVEQPGNYTFAVTSDDGARLYVDRRLVVDNWGEHGAIRKTGQIALDEGSHAILIQYFQAGGLSGLELAWARDGEPPNPIPKWMLLPERWSYGAVTFQRVLIAVWSALTIAMAVLAAWWAFQAGWRPIRNFRRRSKGRVLALAAHGVVLAVVGFFYVAAATAHGERVNTFKARGDQTVILVAAKNLYANWHGQNPPVPGDRNRMPLYPAYQALFYDRRLSDDEFFKAGKILNIRLSLVLLAVLAGIFAKYLPTLVSINLTLIVALGYFIFKAAYVQPDVLFYFLFFVTFLLLCRSFEETDGAKTAMLGVFAGLLAALTHLTKAVMPPLVVIFLIVYSAREVGRLVQRWREPAGGTRSDAIRIFIWRIAGAGLFVVCFLAVLYPYISNSKRMFGSYFYNVNTTFYMWYDNWPTALSAASTYGPNLDSQQMPRDELPSMRRYWRTHSVEQIARRFADGFKDIALRSYQTFWYLKYVTLYMAFALVLIASNARTFRQLIQRHAALAVFMLLYGSVYLAATAFYAPISDTGTTRFLLPHIAPLMFVLSYLFARTPLRNTQWTVSGIKVTPTSFHVFVLVALAVDMTFTLWPRIMTTYGGF